MRNNTIRAGSWVRATLFLLAVLCAPAAFAQPATLYYPVGDCDEGAGSGSVPRLHVHDPDIPFEGCSGRPGQEGLCTSTDPGNESNWASIGCTQNWWQTNSRCFVALHCEGSSAPHLEHVVDAARIDGGRIYFRRGNTCYTRTCGGSNQALQCSGLGLG